jgi:hypothetical protein
MMDGKTANSLPPRLQALLVVARSFYLASGSLLIIPAFHGWRMNAFAWSDTYMWFTLFGLILILQAVFGLSAKWFTNPPEMASFRVWSMLVTGAGFLLAVLWWVLVR